MAEARRFADHVYGHAGHLTYRPRDDGAAGEPGSLHTTRLTSKIPHFRQIGASAELYPPSQSEPPKPTHEHRFAERNLQRRWLLKSHPEAFMGNLGVAGLLAEDFAKFNRLDDSPANKSLLAMGQIIDLSNPGKPAMATVLALATGESGELLRIARVMDSRWTWEDDKDTMLHLSVIDPVDREDEVVWASDGLPISQIKFATSVSHQDNNRWILVQKETSTTILRPEYTKVPRVRSHQYRNFRPALSRIDPAPLLTLGHHDTGGNAHSDVAFNPPGDNKAAQLCVVDECGYWTMWDIVAFSRIRTTKKDLRLSLTRCGHIFEGALTEVPTNSPYPVEKHGVLFVGIDQVDNFWAASLPDAGGPRRSRHMVLWSSELFRVIDIETNSFLPDIKGFSTAKNRFGRILNVQPSPVDQNHVFVLTTQFVIWVDVLSLDKDSSSPRPAILLTCTHGVDDSGGSGMRISVNRSTEQDNANPIVLVHTPGGSEMRIVWFSFDPRGNLPRFYSQKTLASPAQSLQPGLRPFRPQELFFQPSRITCPSRASGLGSRYRQKGVQFYQGMMLGEDLSVRYCMCFASTDPTIEVTLPVRRIGWTQSDQRRRWRRKRLRILRHVGPAVVVPDSMTDEALKALSRRSSQREMGTALVEAGRAKPTTPTLLPFDEALSAISERLRGTVGQLTGGLRTEILGLLQGAIEDGHSSGILPFTTWREISMRGAVTGESGLIPPEDLEEAVQDMLLGTDERTVVTQLALHPRGKPAGPVGNLLNLYEQLASIWLEPVSKGLTEGARQMRSSWLSSLTLELFLSMHGVTVQQNVSLFGADQFAAEESSQDKPPSSTAFPSSSQTLPSSPPSTAPGVEADPAIQRLQLLAPGIRPGNFSTTKKLDVLSYWPTERGLDPADYTSSVALASDKKLDGVRQRLQKIESKRKAMSEKYKRPPSMRSGPPTSQEMPGEPVNNPMTPRQIMSSQQPMPSSSQSHGPPEISMSQPMPGIFGGDRSNKKSVKKKPKKKSGFR